VDVEKNIAAIIGAGLIGRAWAVVFARAGWTVRLFDAVPAQLTVARQQIVQTLADQERVGLVADAPAALGRIVPCTRLIEAVTDAAWVQENLPEEVAIKQTAFAELDRLASPDAIVVLGCRPGGSEGGQAALYRRAHRAARAFHDNGCTAIIASGGRRWRGVSEADLLADVLASLGVPRASVVRELCSLSTMENAWYSAELLRAGGYVRPAIVTCDWHMPRALMCFDSVGIAAIGLSAITPERPVSTRVSDYVRERTKRFLDRRAAARWNGA